MLASCDAAAALGLPFDDQNGNEFVYVDVFFSERTHLRVSLDSFPIASHARFPRSPRPAPPHRALDPPLLNHATSPTTPRRTPKIVPPSGQHPRGSERARGQRSLGILQHEGQLRLHGRLDEGLRRACGPHAGGRRGRAHLRRRLRLDLQLHGERGVDAQPRLGGGRRIPGGQEDRLEPGGQQRRGRCFQGLWRAYVPPSLRGGTHGERSGVERGVEPPSHRWMQLLVCERGRLDDGTHLLFFVRP